MARFEEIIVGILTELISPSDAFLLLEASYFYELPEVTAKCRAYIDQNIQQLIKTPEFFEIDTSTMIRVLESDNLQIAEIDLFKDGLLKLFDDIILNSVYGDIGIQSSRGTILF